MDINIDDMSNTKWEKEFFGIAEEYYFKVNVTDEILEDIFVTTEKGLIITLKEFKSEVIENITNLGISEKDFYLNRILVRASEIIVNIIGINGGFFVDSIDELGEITLHDMSLFYQLPTVKDINEGEVKAYFSMKSKFKNEIIEYISKLIKLNDNTINPFQSIDLEPILNQKLQTNLNITQREILYDLLVKDQFIPDSTDKESFVWVFGKPNEKQPEIFHPIEWNKNKQLLREFLEAIKRDNVKISEIEKIAPLLFYKNGDPLKLAKNKIKETLDHRRLKKIIATSLNS